MTDGEIILSCQNRGMKLIEIANKLRVSTSYLTAIKRGEREFGDLRRDTALSILKSLDDTQQSCSSTNNQSNRLEQIEAELTILKIALAQLSERIKRLEK